MHSPDNYKSLSIVVPIFNDGHLANALCSEIRNIFQSFFATQNLSQKLEVVFVDDGSKNDSVAHLLSVRKEFNFVRVIILSRNFGQQAALSCGYWYSRGSRTAVLDVDMEDHPSFLPTMLDKMEKEGANICQGVRIRRRNSFFKNVTSVFFKWALYRAMELEIPLNHSTLRIFDRKAIDAFNRFKESGRFVPGIESLIGFKRTYVPVQHVIASKPSSYNFRRRLRLAVDALIGITDLPMKIMTAVSLLLFSLGVGYGFFLVTRRLLGGEALLGWTSVISVLLIGFGIIGFCISVLGLYLIKILREVQDRPLFIVNEIYEQQSTSLSGPQS